MKKYTVALLLFFILPASQTLGAVLRVPADFATIQEGLDAAVAGDIVEVAAGVYFEKVSFPRSGAPGQSIVLRGAPGSRPILDGSGVPGQNMVLVASRSHLRIEGFEIRNHLNVNDGSGIRIIGSGTDLQIRDNIIHEIRGDHAMGITVYGMEPEPISQLVIDGNVIHDCDPADSEALTLNGNVMGFEVTNNLVRDVNNIGIDLIGGETNIQPDATLVAREGLVRGNTVLRVNSFGGFAGGIYVDGGRDIVIENNLVAESDLGLEVGAENAGRVAENIIVRNNVLMHNERAGLVFGGFNSSVGRADNNLFTGNTLYHNNTVGRSGQDTYFQGGSLGEVWVQFASNNRVTGNVIYAGVENVFVGSFDAGSSIGNVFDYNLYFNASGLDNGGFSLNGNGYSGLQEWRTMTGQDPSSLFADPLFADGPAGDFHLTAVSPAIDRGDPLYTPDVGEADLDGQARVSGMAIDLGADEVGTGTEIFADGFESGNTSAWSSVTP